MPVYYYGFYLIRINSVLDFEQRNEFIDLKILNYYEFMFV